MRKLLQLIWWRSHCCCYGAYCHTLFISGKYHSETLKRMLEKYRNGNSYVGSMDDGSF